MLRNASGGELLADAAQGFGRDAQVGGNQVQGHALQHGWVLLQQAGILFLRCQANGAFQPPLQGHVGVLVEQPDVSFILGHLRQQLLVVLPLDEQQAGIFQYLDV